MIHQSQSVGIETTLKVAFKTLHFDHQDLLGIETNVARKVKSV